MTGPKLAANRMPNCGISRRLNGLPLRAGWGPRSVVSKEAGRFAIVGMVATALSASVYNILVHAEASTSSTFSNMPLVTLVFANAVGMVASYVGTSSWVFRGRHTGRLGGLVGFVLVNVVSWSIPLVALWFTRHVLARTDPVSDNIAVNVVGLGLGTLARFWLLRRSVFQEQKHEWASHYLKPSDRPLPPPKRGP